MALINEKSMDFGGMELECAELIATTSVTIGTATLTDTEFTTLDGITAGTVTANKTVIVDANKDISEFRNVGLTGSLTFGVGGLLNVDSGTTTAAAGAATLNKMAGVVTTEALTTAGLASYTLTLTNSTIAAADLVFFSIANGTNTAGTPLTGLAKPSAGSCTFTVYNAHGTVALNGTIVISFFVLKA